MALRESAIGSALLAFLLGFLEFTPEYVVELVSEGTLGWLPRLDTAGQTVVLYTVFLRGAAFLVGTVAVFALGYWIGSRIDLRTVYRRLALAIGAGGAIGYLAFGIVMVVVADSGGITGSGGVVVGFFEAAVALSRPIGIGIQFAVVGFAGAAFAHLSTDTVTSGSARLTTDGASATDPSE